MRREKRKRKETRRPFVFFFLACSIMCRKEQGSDGGPSKTVEQVKKK